MIDVTLQVSAIAIVEAAKVAPFILQYCNLCFCAPPLRFAFERSRRFGLCSPARPALLLQQLLLLLQLQLLLLLLIACCSPAPSARCRSAFGAIRAFVKLSGTETLSLFRTTFWSTPPK